MRALPLLILLLAPPLAAQPSWQDARLVATALTRLAEEDSGHLWGVSLDGPLMIADPDSRLAWATRPAPGFAEEAGFWKGVLPDSVPIANTATDWGEHRWTMMAWPLPETETGLRRLLSHEAFHRIQPQAGLPQEGGSNPHLGSRDGRYWLILEMRALAAALRGDASRVGDALAARNARLAIFPDAASAENALLLHEGLAQYTGLRLSGLDLEAAREAAARDLEEAEDAASFVRTFAYATGPAWGLILDEMRADWRDHIAPDTDLPGLLPIRPAADPDFDSLGATHLAATEDALEAERQRRHEMQLERYVTHPHLFLGFRQMQVSFDPGQVETLPDHGQVYQGLRLSDAWGVLEVDGGALIRQDWSGVVVPAPGAFASPILGDGYTLTLNAGWTLREDGSKRWVLEQGDR
ncbi:MAG: hypothetical protein JJ896_06280 [Rhodothermales bacterium]|nr:hypothetical protein [Rhodothermales bacterium]MBO6779241.1 hypothetical protein [Rhodothermales bacterium]